MEHSLIAFVWMCSYSSRWCTCNGVRHTPEYHIYESSSLGSLIFHKTFEKTLSFATFYRGQFHMTSWRGKCCREITYTHALKFTMAYWTYAAIVYNSIPCTTKLIWRYPYISTTIMKVANLRLLICNQAILIGRPPCNLTKNICSPNNTWTTLFFFICIFFSHGWYIEVWRQ